MVRPRGTTWRTSEGCGLQRKRRPSRFENTLPRLSNACTAIFSFSSTWILRSVVRISRRWIAATNTSQRSRFPSASSATIIAEPFSSDDEVAVTRATEEHFPAGKGSQFVTSDFCVPSAASSLSDEEQDSSVLGSRSMVTVATSGRDELHLKHPDAGKARRMWDAERCASFASASSARGVYGNSTFTSFSLCRFAYARCSCRKSAAVRDHSRQVTPRI
jgi:hypothetical protein